VLQFSTKPEKKKKHHRDSDSIFDLEMSISSLSLPFSSQPPNSLQPPCILKSVLTQRHFNISLTLFQALAATQGPWAWMSQGGFFWQQIDMPRPLVAFLFLISKKSVVLQGPAMDYIDKHICQSLKLSVLGSDQERLFRVKKSFVLTVLTNWRRHTRAHLNGVQQIIMFAQQSHFSLHKFCYIVFFFF